MASARYQFECPKIRRFGVLECWSFGDLRKGPSFSFSVVRVHIFPKSWWLKGTTKPPNYSICCLLSACKTCSRMCKQARGEHANISKTLPTTLQKYFQRWAVGRSARVLKSKFPALPLPTSSRRLMSTPSPLANTKLSTPGHHHQPLGSKKRLKKSS